MKKANKDQQQVQTNFRSVWTERERVERRLLAQQKQWWLFETIELRALPSVRKPEASPLAESLCFVKPN